ncbi:hypothetical protein EX30DRAFT_111423 [Ascodesmis nigricans]|uniref:Zn(2)-C6 fungal-type domain-containing protein n=1 Tax=Ascodesmis nigricans TaxID=341454 RepID=A0A4S2MQ42_9PEZI|nr:hypothetical protein EX30DRAFT_111423 [Ascodesmis nigricans]
MPSGSGSRRPHKKSRTGCPKCRKRRIKCDEIRPQCGNCTRHGVICDYPSMLSSSSPHSSGSAAQHPSPSTSLVSQQPPPHTDLILMHFYTQRTACTFSNIPVVQNLWQNEVPQIGYKFRFVMDSLLSIAALHMSTERGHSNTDFLSIAIKHHNAAVKGMSAELAHVHPANCEALLVTSCTILMYSFFIASMPTIPGVEVKPASWVLCLRGVNGIISLSYDWVIRGLIGDLLRPWFLSNESLDPEIDARITQLYTLSTDRTLPSAEELDDADVSSAYFHATSKLRKSFCGAESSNDHISNVFAWPIWVSEKFVELLQRNHPRALIIWAHYTVLLDELEFWWSEGIGDWEMGQVEQLLPPEWVHWLEWPKRRMREHRERMARNDDQKIIDSLIVPEMNFNEWVAV